MSRKITLGGERLGTGDKVQIDLHGFDRSTFNLSGKWRSSMSAGTVVPCGWYLGLPGDKFEIDLAAELYTLPTVGPLYGSYKVQIDAFITPIRLYSRSLMINRTDIGMNMNMVKLPQIEVEGLNPRTTTGLSFDNYQINPSSILSYYGIKGVGHAPL